MVLLYITSQFYNLVRSRISSSETRVYVVAILQKPIDIDSNQTGSLNDLKYMCHTSKNTTAILVRDMQLQDEDCIPQSQSWLQVERTRRHPR